MTLRRLLSPTDLAGLVLVATLTAWILATASLSGRSPWPMLLTLLLCTAAFAVGRIGTALLARWVVPAAVVALALIVFLRSPEGNLSILSARGFLGYTNARAAFFVQAAFAVVLIVAAARSWKTAPLVLPAAAAGALFVVVPIASRSLGGFLSSLFLIPAVFVAVVRRGERAVMAGAIVILMAAVASSFLLAREFSDGFGSVREHRLADALDYGRAVAWWEAYEMLRDHPSFGVGPGGFRDLSRQAQLRPDLGRAHHEFLEVGAETGVVGLVLLLALLGWAFRRLARPLTVPSTVAALALASLATHACADYLFHFPLLPAITSALVGSGTSAKRRRRAPSRVVQRSSP